MQCFLGFVLFLLCAALAPAVRADGPQAAHPHGEQLTDRGRVLVLLNLSGGFSNDDSTLYRRYEERWISGTPGVIYFVRDTFGIGGYVGGGYGRGGLIKTHHEVSAGLNALYDLRFTPTTGLYVVPGVGYAYEAMVFDVGRALNQLLGAAISPPRTVDFNRGAIAMSLRLPLVYHPVPNIALGVGPELLYDVFIHNQNALGVHQPATRYRLALAAYFASSF
jgi:hypothetical protein